MSARNIAAAAKTMWLTHAARVPQPWTAGRAVVSLTFDDVPLSAFTEGLPILDRYQIKSTFYVCTAIDNSGRPHLGAPEIAALADQGHEIACHSSTHFSVRLSGPHGLAEDCRANRQVLNQMTGGRWPVNFSFPHGEVSVRVKGPMTKIYRSLRSTRVGVNHGVFDLACLKAVPVYHGNFDEAFITRWVERAIARRGWLIFYTHGVSARGEKPPASFDLRAEQLEILADLVRERGVAIRTVNDVLDDLLRSKRPNTRKSTDI